MNCRTTSAQKLTKKLGFKQCDVILTKKQSMLKKIKISFEGENVKIQSSVTGLTQIFMIIMEIILYIHACNGN